MKLQLRSASKRMLKLAVPAVVVLLLMVLPSLVMGQNPGDNPDNRPPEVPLDPRMTVLLIAVGAFLAVKVMRRGLPQQVATVKA